MNNIKLKVNTILNSAVNDNKINYSKLENTELKGFESFLPDDSNFSHEVTIAYLEYIKDKDDLDIHEETNSEFTDYFLSNKSLAYLIKWSETSFGHVLDFIDGQKLEFEWINCLHSLLYHSCYNHVESIADDLYGYFEEFKQEE